MRQMVLTAKKVKCMQTSLLDEEVEVLTKIQKKKLVHIVKKHVLFSSLFI